MNKTFSLLFYVKKSKAIADGTAPIYLRITIDGKQTEISSKRYILPEKWNSQAQKVDGLTETVKSLNAYLKTLEQQVYDAHHEMLKDKAEVTTCTLKSKLLGTDEKQRMLVPIFQDHNQKIETLVGDEFASGTLERYKTSLKHTIEFLKWKYNVSDIDIRKIDHAFVTEYEFYLRSIRKCNNNSAVKYIKNFGKIIRICIANGWLDKNPFANYKAKVKEVERAFLVEEEIRAILHKGFQSERISLVRDIFIFSCYTSLAYIDVKQLTRSHISIGIDGERWIFTNRQKTDTQSNIPLLPLAEQILSKYKDHPQCLNQDRALPVLSNQKMNSYLKEIADLCSIKKELTFQTVGSYMACFKLMEGTEVPVELAESCVPFDVGPLSPPMLMAPADSSVLKSQPAMFTWQPPSPLAMFEQLHYELVIAEILPGQKPEEAVELNAPFYTDLDVQGNVMSYTGAYPSFEKGKWYAWQVVAKDGGDYAAKTDVWDFSVTTNPMTPKQSPGISYVKLKRGYEAGPSLCKGILNLEYTNEINDVQASYTIVGLDKGDNHVIESGTLKLKPGQNLIDLPLDKKFEDNKKYRLQLINSRSEDWNVKFIINRS